MKVYLVLICLAAMATVSGAFACTDSAQCGPSQMCLNSVCQGQIDPCYSCPRGSQCGWDGTCHIKSSPPIALTSNENTSTNCEWVEVARTPFTTGCNRHAPDCSSKFTAECLSTQITTRNTCTGEVKTDKIDEGCFCC